MSTPNLWSKDNPWGHVPESCGTLDCPGCYAAAYVPMDQRTSSEFSTYLFNSGRTMDEVDVPWDDEEAEAGRLMPDDAYTNDGA